MKKMGGYTRGNYTYFVHYKRLKIDIMKAISQHINFDYFQNSAIESIKKNRNELYLKTVQCKNMLRRINKLNPKI